jgi:hypothetical protein
MSLPSAIRRKKGKAVIMWYCSGLKCSLCSNSAAHTASMDTKEDKYTVDLFIGPLKMSE